MVNKNNYIPERGDLVYLNFSPQSGHEQAGRRPAIVISPAKYNQIFNLCLVCPITSKDKSGVFQVAIKTPKISGYILADQLKSTDWRSRSIQFIDKINLNQYKEIQAKILTLIN